MSLGKDNYKKWSNCNIKASLWAILWWGFWHNSKIGIHKGWAGVNWPCGHWGNALGQWGSNTLGSALRLSSQFRKCQNCCENCICLRGPIGGAAAQRRPQSTTGSEKTRALVILMFEKKEKQKHKKDGNFTWKKKWKDKRNFKKKKKSQRQQHLIIHGADSSLHWKSLLSITNRWMIEVNSKYFYRL